MPAPDLKAPRFRRRHQGTINKASMALLRAQVPGVADLSDKQLEQLLNRINHAVWQGVIALPDGVELPEQLGRLFIGSCEGLLCKRVNYKSSQELGVTVKHRNWASDDYQAKIFYQNHRERQAEPTVPDRYQFKHRELWAFKGCRLFTRSVGENYPQLWQQYVVVKPTRKAKAIEFVEGQLFERRLANQEKLATYNEFDF